MIKLYNSKTKQIEEFKPIKENEVSMYVCGPTVYNHAHIGNARPLIVFDTLRRVFEANGYEVKYVSNYTDVDDKIINKAKEEGVSEKEIAERYIAAYQKIRDDLNTEKLYATPRVTECMNDIIAFIDLLVKKGHAYEADGDVYFRVMSIPTYGEISKQRVDDLLVGARIEENSKKENPLDFALWKKMEEGIRWESPWSMGRPGWHTECVVMIDKIFGGQIDIHGGGADLRFPHHENEVAQSRGCYGHGIANYWLHNAMININGEKMSKSLGNVWWAKDVIEKLGANVVRWLMNSVQYRGECNLSDESIETAKTELAKVETALKQAMIKLETASKTDLTSMDHESFNRFLEAMNDDMNTPNAYAVIFDTVKQLNGQVRQREINVDKVNGLVNSLLKMLNVLGIKEERLSLNDEDKALFEKWNAYKKEKDFENADKVRAILIERGLA